MNEAAFIEANTDLRPVPHVPEIRLHVAHEAIALWQKTEEELAEIGLPPPFWAFAWAGGQGLARFILDHPEVVRGKVILDFAAGSGLVGIAAAMAGAHSVVAADIDSFAVAAIGLNAQANAVCVSGLGANLVGHDGGWDVVLAGDICYERELAGQVIAWLAALEKRGAGVFIGDPGRSYLPKDRLVEIASYEVPVVGALEDNAIKRTGVWRLCP